MGSEETSCRYAKEIRMRRLYVDREISWLLYLIRDGFSCIIYSNTSRNTKTNLLKFTALFDDDDNDINGQWKPNPFGIFFKSITHRKASSAPKSFLIGHWYNFVSFRRFLFCWDSDSVFVCSAVFHPVMDEYQISDSPLAFINWLNPFVKSINIHAARHF